jgi:hypothetical protein
LGRVYQVVILDKILSQAYAKQLEVRSAEEAKLRIAEGR